MASKERRSYKKHEAKEEVDHWCTLYPDYASIVEDIRETLRVRDSRSGRDFVVPSATTITRSRYAHAVAD